MDTRPEMKKYRGLISAAIIATLAAIVFVAGIVAIILGIAGKYEAIKITLIMSGVGSIIISAFLFVISNIAEDLHWQSYLKEYYGEEAVKYHNKTLQSLQFIEEMIQQKYYPKPIPNASDFNMPQTQQSDQPMPNAQEGQPRKQVRIVETSKAMEQMVTPEENNSDYKAQYMRPGSKKRRNYSAIQYEPEPQRQLSDKNIKNS